MNPYGEGKTAPGRRRPKKIIVEAHTNWDIPKKAIGEVERIFYNCVDTCPCDVEGDITFHTSATGPYPAVGCKWIDDDTLRCRGTIFVEEDAAPWGPPGYTEPDGDAYAFINRVNNVARQNSLDRDYTLATVIAHEMLHHGIAGTRGHWQGGKEGWVDSKIGTVSSDNPGKKPAELSPGACKRLCRKLEID